MLRTFTRKFCTFATKTSQKVNQEASSGPITKVKDFKFGRGSSLGMNEESTPKMIHNYLQSHVVGQEDSKKALAIAYSTFTYILGV